LSSVAPRGGPAGTAGQALVELALLLPLLGAIFLLLLAGGQWIAEEIALTNAARTAAVAAADAVNRGSDPTAAAIAAADAEGGALRCGGGSAPPSCVAVVTETGPLSGATLEAVTVYETTPSWWPGEPRWTLTARAAAAVAG
jgi:Flp pilus assembly protein TadG